jgi:hypothetical protein
LSRNVGDGGIGGTDGALDTEELSAVLGLRSGLDGESRESSKTDGVLKIKLIISNL